tara:strand:- start:1823 stop:3952 length:2130 start_codon:yes stop_codon:yes gene_type:complete
MKKISQLFSVFLITLFYFTGCSSTGTSVKSPDNTLSLNVVSEGGHIFYSVSKNKTEIIEKSKLGIISDKFNLSEGLKIANISYNNKNEEWTQVWGEQKVVQDHYNEMILSLESNSNDFSLIVRFKLYDDGLGFRYEIDKNEEIIPFSILDEKTEFKLTEDSESWWIPAYAYRRYEFLYANTLISEINRDKFSELVEHLHDPRIGPEAVQTPFTTQRKDGITIAIHEANLTNYSSMTLKANGTSHLECDLIPWSDGDKVKTQTPMVSPWRTIIVGNNPSEIIMSTITLNLNEPNKIQDVSWIQPGKYIGLWWEMIGTNQSTWGSGPHHGATTEKVKKYIDFGSKYGFEGLLVEGWNTGWDENWCCTGEGEAFDFYHSHPDFDDKEVAKYAKEKGIRLVGHHETGTQISNYESQLDSAFAYCQKMGIRVVKTGYVNDGSQNIKRIKSDGTHVKEWHHGQYMVEHFRRVLETSAKYEVGIVVHEPIKDTGLRRTYPNMLSREGARGQEFNGFMPKDWNNKPNHTTILPYTRLLSSPMDYTPGIFNLKDYRYNSPEDRKINTTHHIPSTIAKELALYVIIYAPVQMAADLPENYEGHKGFKFILDVPVDWSESLALNGEIGKYITMARKDVNSDDWYLGSITNEEKRQIDVDLSFLDPELSYSATIYKDPENGGWESKPESLEIIEMVFNNSDMYSIVLPEGGGQAIKFSPIN